MSQSARATAPPGPHQPLFRGVDLGAFHSVCASSTETEGSIISVDVNALANRSTPSLVAYEGSGTRLIGEAAEGSVTRFPGSTITQLVETFFDSAKLVGEQQAAAKQALRTWQFAPDSGRVINIGEFGPEAEKKISLEAALTCFLKKLLDLKSVGSGGSAHAKITLAVPDAVAAESDKAVIERLVKAVQASQVLESGPTEGKLELAHHADCLATQWVHKYRDRLVEANEDCYCLIVDVGFSHTTISLVRAGRKREAVRPAAKSTEEREGGEGAPPAKEKEEEVVAKEPEAVGAIVGKKTVPLGVRDFIVALGTSALDYAKTLGPHGAEIELPSKKGFKLLQTCQKALKELSMLPDAKIALECWLSEDDDFVMDLKRKDLEAAMDAQLNAIEHAVAEVVAMLPIVAAAGEEELLLRNQVGSNAKLDYIEVVGGGVRIPAVARRIAKACGVDEEEQSTRLGRGLDGSSAVATGACLRSAGKMYGIVSPLAAINVADIIASPDDQALFELEKRMGAVEDAEVARLAKINDLEAYLFEARTLVSSNKSFFEDAEAVEKEIDCVEKWFFDNIDDATLDGELFVEKHESLKKLIHEKGARYFEAERAKEAALNDELEKA